VWVRFPSPAPFLVVCRVPALSWDAAHVIAQFPQHRRGYSVEIVSRWSHPSVIDTPHNIRSGQIPIAHRRC
jgi:hypothetical protein